jgi:hypothetical protein
MNRTGTAVSEWVHLGEIAVILGINGVAGSPRPVSGEVKGISPDRLPSCDGADISAATPISGFQGRDHGD